MHGATSFAVLLLGICASGVASGAFALARPAEQPTIKLSNQLAVALGRHFGCKEAAKRRTRRATESMEQLNYYKLFHRLIKFRLRFFNNAAFVRVLFRLNGIDLIFLLRF